MLFVQYFLIIFSAVVINNTGAQECKPNKFDENTMSLEKLLHQSILCNYKPGIRPVLKYSTQTNITTEMIVSRVRSSYDRSAIDTVSLEIGLTLSWRDEFINWDPNFYSGIEETVIPGSKIWYPRLTIMNADYDYESKFNSPCVVKSTGHVSCSGDFAFSAKCSKTFKHWPNDLHNCTVEFGMWMHKDENVNVHLSNSKISVSPSIEINKWKLLDMELNKVEETFSLIEFPGVVLKFAIQRSPSQVNLLQIFVMPLIMTLLATAASVSMEIKSLERIIVVVFNIHLNMDFLSAVMNRLPAVEEELAAAVVYTRQSFMVACAILIISVLSRYFAKKSTEPPQKIRQIIGIMDSGVGKIIMFREFDDSFFVAPFLDDLEGLTEHKTTSEANDEWNRFAHILNRVFGICVYVAYFFMLLKFAI